MFRSRRGRKPPAGLQARLARATLRAARSAAEKGRCSVAELLFAFGNVDLQAAGTRVRSKGAMLKALDAGVESADAAKAIIECRQRERSAPSPSGAAR